MIVGGLHIVKQGLINNLLLDFAATKITFFFSLWFINECLSFFLRNHLMQYLHLKSELLLVALWHIQGLN